MTKRSLLLAALIGLLPPRLSTAAAPTTPEPGPEQTRLRYFVGTWDFRLAMKPSPFGRGGEI